MTKIKKDKKLSYTENKRLISKTIKNDYIDKIFETWQTKIGNKYYKMNSNISVAECIFLHKLVTTIKPKRIFEFGMANGMSTMIFLDALIKIGGDALYSNDPFQKTVWNSIGLYNASQVKGTVKHIHTEKMSTDNFDDIPNEYFDIVLIDGAHDKPNVILDIMNTKRILKNGGIMVLDDVLHKGVHDAINEVLMNDPNYSRICLVPKKLQNIENYDKNNLDKKYNPDTMFAYIKNIKS